MKHFYFPIFVFLKKFCNKKKEKIPCLNWPNQTQEVQPTGNPTLPRRIPMWGRLVHTLVGAEEATHTFSGPVHQLSPSLPSSRLSPPPPPAKPSLPPAAAVILLLPHRPCVATGLFVYIAMIQC
jgi:hypothetical protein